MLTEKIYFRHENFSFAFNVRDRKVLSEIFHFSLCFHYTPTTEPSSTGCTIKVCVYARIFMHVSCSKYHQLITMDLCHFSPPSLLTTIAAAAAVFITSVMVLPSKKYIIDYNENSYRYVCMQ
jgi:hypothetical protein